MQEDEKFNEFYIKLNVVRNSMINLGKNVSNAKLIKKIMRSLSKRFRIKVTTIKESKDLDTMKIEELVGSLQTYEFSLPQPKKNKFIALKTVRKKRNNSSDEESMYEEDMALIVRKFNRLFKTGKGNFRNTYSKFAEKPNDDSSVATIGRREREKNSCGIQCHECGGYGHIRANCANLQGNTFNVTHNDESNKDDLEKHVNFLAFMTSYKSPHDSYDNESQEEDDLQNTYNNLFEKLSKLRQ